MRSRYPEQDTVEPSQKRYCMNPTLFQGLGLDNLLTEQYVPKIKAILEYMQKNATSGNMIQSNLELTKLEAFPAHALSTMEL